jgi:hypothetical protein
MLPESQPEAQDLHTFLEPDHPVWQIADIFPGTGIGDQAWAAYQRGLPALLKSSPDQWVAYHGDRQLGVGPLPTRLYDECVASGVSPSELVICRIQPLGDGQEFLGMGACWIEAGDSEVDPKPG